MGKDLEEDEDDSGIPVHKRRILIRPRHYTALLLLKERDEVDIGESVNRAVREFLERQQLWPPPDSPKT